MKLQFDICFCSFWYCSEWPRQKERSMKF